MRVKCTDAELNCVTVGKIYHVGWVDDDGDFWIIDDNGEEFLMFSYECEVME